MFLICYGCMSLKLLTAQWLKNYITLLFLLIYVMKDLYNISDVFSDQESHSEIDTTVILDPFSCS